MALKKPLVINAGQIDQLQAGDTLDAPIGDVEVLTLTNDNAGSLVIGTPVYMAAADHVDKAKADAVGTVNVIGLVLATSIATSASGVVQTDGVVVATTGQWDAVTGGSGGLTFNTIYYLDQTTAGKITSTAPSTAGQFVKEIGIGISTTEMKLSNNSRRVKL